jgi:hypothetical protein
MNQLAATPRKELGAVTATEQAMYGAMCGHYDAMMLHASASYYDQIWAAAKTVFMIQLRSLVTGEAAHAPPHWPRTISDLLQQIARAHFIQPGHNEFQLQLFELAYKQEPRILISAIEKFDYAHPDSLRFLFHLRQVLLPIFGEAFTEIAPLSDDVAVRYAIHLLAT